MKIKVAIAALSCMALSACATVVQGTTQQVSISSNPSAAQVSIDGLLTGKTPVVVDLKRKRAHTIKIELDGYMPFETALTRKMSGWVWGNLVFGGIVGLVVDASAGGMYKLTPDQVSAEMRNQVAAALPESDGLYLAIVLQPKPEWEKVGQLARAD